MIGPHVIPTGSLALSLKNVEKEQRSMRSYSEDKEEEDQDIFGTNSSKKKYQERIFPFVSLVASVGI